MELVGSLRPGLDRGAAGRAQGPDHLHTAVAALGHTRRFSGQNRSCGGFGVGGVALLDATARASPPVLRAFHLQHLDPPGPQMAGEPRPVAAGTLYPGAPHGAKTLRPVEEPLVTLRGRRRARLAQTPAQVVHGHGYVEVEVCVHAPDVTATSVSGLSAPIVVTSQAPFDVALIFHPRSGRERTIL